MQTVTSNLDLTERKNAINFNLKVDSVKGRLGIYAWMITEILSSGIYWPQRSSFPKEVKTQKTAKTITKLLILADLTIFSINLSPVLPTHQIWRYSDHFCSIYNTINFFRFFLKSRNSHKWGKKCSKRRNIWFGSSVVWKSIEKVIKS